MVRMTKSRLLVAHLETTARECCRVTDLDKRKIKKVLISLFLIVPVILPDGLRLWCCTMMHWSCAACQAACRYTQPVLYKQINKHPRTEAVPLGSTWQIFEGQVAGHPGSTAVRRHGMKKASVWIFNHIQLGAISSLHGKGAAGYILIASSKLGIAG